MMPPDRVHPGSEWGSDDRIAAKQVDHLWLGPLPRLEPVAKGNISHSLRRLETQGLIVMTRTPGGKTESVYLTAAGRQKALKLTGRYE